MIESICDYKKGWTNLSNATKELGELAGLTPDVAAALLKNMKRDNVTNIRGYSKEPTRLAKSKIGRSNEPKK
jgi:hypothetical protein|tara:strand:- start:1826 stop:2041 length:216 start_codon:yes stop_codon:yes gene_type:complete